MPGKVTLVLGGVRSGKSAFAEELAGRSGEQVLYLATGQATDGEMRERIRRHKERRSAQWHTLEEPVALPEALGRVMAEQAEFAVILLDSVDIWVSNLMLADEEGYPAATEGSAMDALELTVSLCRENAGQAILVSSEVGLSLVPTSRLGRQFQDLLGTVNQRAAALADEVFLVVAGIPVKVKPP